ncbi:MAG: glycosyltransferase family 9 protein [bacterium]|nr:glycosyltransferase family 9 protein [bacterium]
MSSQNEVAVKKKLLIVAITRLGDLLQASPTIGGLKMENPGSHLTVLVDKGFSEICYGIPGIDEVFEIDLAMMVRSMARGGAGIIEAYSYFDSIVEKLRSNGYDFVLNMSSSSYTAVLLRLLDVADSRGWASDEEGCRLITNPWSMLFAASVYHSNRDYNSINLVDIFRCCSGVRKHPRRLIYEVKDEARGTMRSRLADLGYDGSKPLVCIQAGASQEKRQWSAANFAELTGKLVDRLGAFVVFTGSKSEQAIIDRIIELALEHDNDGLRAKNIFSVAGSTNLKELGALTEAANVLITGDTGTMHMAVACGTNVVAIFLASALCYETGPYSVGNLVVQARISCCPCNPNFPCARPDCHEQITPELVFQLTKLRLEKSDEALRNYVVSEDLCPSAEASVFFTDFDGDDFLECVPLNAETGRNGFAKELFVRSRAVYRELWKHEFDAIDVRDIRVDHNCQPAPVEYYDAGIREYFRISDNGIALLSDLLRLIRDVHSDPRMLGELTRQIEYNDRSVEEVGLAWPVLGTMARIFVMEKDNLRGDDPGKVASEMIEIYQRLKRRAGLFERLMQVDAN